VKGPQVTEGVHPCLWPGCKEIVSTRFETCRRHYERLPAKLRGWLLAAKAGRDVVTARTDPAYRRACAISRQWAKSHPDPELPPFLPGERVTLAGTLFESCPATVTAARLVARPDGTAAWTVETTAGNYPPTALIKTS
jgi:hypothetical protein